MFKPVNSRSLVTDNSPYIKALNFLYRDFAQKDGYVEKLGFLKQQKNLKSSDLDFFREQAQDSIRTIGFKPKDMIDSLLVIAKLQREPQWSASRLKTNKADQESLDMIGRVLITYLPDQALEAEIKPIMKRIASLRTTAAKKLLGNLAEAFDHNRASAMTTNDAQFSQLARAYQRNMHISTMGAGFGRRGSGWRQVAEAISQVDRNMRP